MSFLPSCPWTGKIIELINWYVLFEALCIIILLWLIILSCLNLSIIAFQCYFYLFNAKLFMIAFTHACMIPIVFTWSVSLMESNMILAFLYSSESFDSAKLYSCCKIVSVSINVWLCLLCVLDWIRLDLFLWFLIGIVLSPNSKINQSIIPTGQNIILTNLRSCWVEGKLSI